ncbi:MAG: amino acid ABC transporter substrate-binding protein [Proteobacteria bacterium]|nr:amino acid ABC transporter substrate-binding protein [Pseudomonadota bacterium]
MRSLPLIALLLTLFSSSLLAAIKNSPGETLSTVRHRGYLICGVSQGLTGFSTVDDKGQWQGLDVDFCKAVASAIFGDANKVSYVPLSAKDRFTALQSGDIDLLSRNTSWTLLRDTTLGLNFIGTIYYDAQGLMIHKSAGIKSANELNGAIICTNTGTTTELNIADFFKAHQLKYQIITFEKSDETLSAYEAGRCDVYSTDMSALAAQKLKLKNPHDHFILPERISKEPLSPVVRQGDEPWANIIRWVLFALVNAEELGITQNNIKLSLNASDSNIQRLLGKKDNLGEKLNLPNDWAYQAILQVGNYGEIFERNLGQKSPLKIERGLNALWSQGGILYAPPLR